jgi:hypothetical protein
MSEQELEGTQPEEDDVEAHRKQKRGEGEAPEDTGQRSEASDEPDFEAHRKQK